MSTDLKIRPLLPDDLFRKLEVELRAGNLETMREIAPI